MHTDRSHDGCSSIKEIATVAKRKGLDGIAVTDHDLSLMEGDAMRITEELGLLVLPGIEVTTAAGHLLVINPKRELNDPALEKVVESAADDGSIIIVPHPMDPISHGMGESAALSILRFSPLVETLNASTLARYNKRAEGFAIRNALPRVGGSDAHIADAVGDAYTIVESPSCDMESVLHSISKGNTKPAGKRTSLQVSLKTVFSRLAKPLTNR